MKKKVIVTVPHATCPDEHDEEAWRSTGDHACDFCGPRAGRELAEALRRRCRSAEVVLTEADVPRTTVDMNRRPSRRSPWRTRLAAALDGGDVLFLIDAHSFPADHAPFFGNDLVVYTEAKPLPWQVELTAAIEGGAGAGALTCGMISNPTTTDLIRDAHEHGVPAVLIEFSEGLSDAQMSAVCDRIAAFMLDDGARIDCPVACRHCLRTGRPRYLLCTGGCRPAAVYCSHACRFRDAPRHAYDDRCPGMAAWRRSHKET